ncbi:metallophosphoesterase family protein [Rhizomicrobium electricum]|uniref:Metallophosphoesterase n=1 Tax=Rhizomicrobium electricum TaxID=480070 RepID=A0ABN1EY13_9PROT|nr:metallophosphoesterase [Rhizomicrobium electricum]NIJ49867.1 hypothetical protein [Rhizomicrobium electricum]
MSPFTRAGLAAALTLAVALTGAEAGKKRVMPSPPPDDSHVVVITGYLVEEVATETVRAAWTQYGPGGVLEARVVVSGKTCPDIAFDLKRQPMQLRASADSGFLTVCSAPVPAGTKQAALAFRKFDNKPPKIGADETAWKTWIEKEYGSPIPTHPSAPVANEEWRQRIEAKTKYDLVPLPVPVADPQRIIIIGDGGCRSKGDKHQDCLKPEAWPFAQVAAEAAKLKPDLVIHVGDYVSREQACPANVAVCQNQPFGDNWAAWDADTFTPLKPLLAVAPVVFTRGNHEDCNREGLGFLRLLGPQPFDPKAGCIPHLPPYSVPFARLNLVVSDNADAPETSVVEPSVPVYRTEIANLANEKAPTWWVLHRPVWGLISGPLGVPIGGNQTLIAAVPESGIPAPVELMLSGHIHTFEAINYTPEPRVPPQILSGRGGDLMDPTPANLHGAIFQGSSGVHVKDGISVPEFGFSLMTRTEDGWRIDVYDGHGRIQRVCQFHNSRVDCPVAKR